MGAKKKLSEHKEKAVKQLMELDRSIDRKVAGKQALVLANQLDDMFTKWFDVHQRIGLCEKIYAVFSKSSDEEAVNVCKTFNLGCRESFSGCHALPLLADEWDDISANAAEKYLAVYPENDPAENYDFSTVNFDISDFFVAGTTKIDLAKLGGEFTHSLVRMCESFAAVYEIMKKMAKTDFGKKFLHDLVYEFGGDRIAEFVEVLHEKPDMETYSFWAYRDGCQSLENYFYDAVDADKYAQLLSTLVKYLYALGKSCCVYAACHERIANIADDSDAASELDVLLNSIEYEYYYKGANRSLADDTFEDDLKQLVSDMLSDITTKNSLNTETFDVDERDLAGVCGTKESKSLEKCVENYGGLLRIALKEMIQAFKGVRTYLNTLFTDMNAEDVAESRAVLEKLRVLFSDNKKSWCKIVDFCEAVGTTPSKDARYLGEFLDKCLSEVSDLVTDTWAIRAKVLTTDLFDADSVDFSGVVADATNAPIKPRTASSTSEVSDSLNEVEFDADPAVLVSNTEISEINTLARATLANLYVNGNKSVQKAVKKRAGASGSKSVYKYVMFTMPDEELTKLLIECSDVFMKR